jgi:hypothetical protein
MKSWSPFVGSGAELNLRPGWKDSMRMGWLKSIHKGRF